ARHGGGADVRAGDQHDAVPGEVAEVPQVAVLDDEDAGALDPLVQLQAGEGRRGIHVTLEIHDLRIVTGSEVEWLVDAGGAGATGGECRSVRRCWGRRVHERA